MLKKAFTLAHSVLTNLESNLSGYQLTHVVEAYDWAIKNVGASVTSSLYHQQLLRSRISTSPIGLRNHIVHFDSVHTFVRKRSVEKPHRSNQIVLTWFHVEPDDPRLSVIQHTQQDIKRIHTSCEATKRILTTAGIDPNKIVVIPLGVDTSLFTPATSGQKQAVRKEFGIPPDRYVIGSFQKDGVGWGEGMEPKLIKGPDLFVQVIDKLRDLHPFVLLTGPSRGYVKSELQKRDIDYLHVYPKSFRDLPKMYHALDLYLITSRVEGGPLSLLEAWASDVPVVSTRVGMVPDISREGETALLADVEDTEALTNQIQRLINDPTLQRRLISQAQKNVVDYSWDNIARRYFEELYRPLL